MNQVASEYFIFKTMWLGEEKDRNNGNINFADYIGLFLKFLVWDT